MAHGSRSRKTPSAPPAARLGQRAARRPSDIEGLYLWFDAMVAQAGPDAAVLRLAALSRKTRSYAPALALGYCLFGLGRRREGVDALRVAYRRSPGEKTLYALSGALLVTDRVDEAIGLLTAHGRVHPLPARPLVNLANAYLAKGQRQKARAALRRIQAPSRKEWEALVASAEQRLRWGRG